MHAARFVLQKGYSAWLARCMRATFSPLYVRAKPEAKLRSRHKWRITDCTGRTFECCVIFLLFRFLEFVVEVVFSGATLVITIAMAVAFLCGSRVHVMFLSLLLLLVMA